MCCASVADIDLVNLCNLVVELYSAANYSAALDKARLGLERAPENIFLLNSAATCAFVLGDSLAAEEYWLAALKIQPEYADACYNLGILYGKARKIEESRDFYKKAIEIKPSHISSRVNLGVMLQENKLLDEAEFWYRDALDISSDNVDLMYNLAALLVEKKEYSEAEFFYKRALSLNPKHHGAYNNLGVMYKTLKKFDRSEWAYRKVIDIDPENLNAWRNLGLLLQDLCRFIEAEQCFRKALAINPQDGDARWSLGMLLLYLGRFEEGWACYESRYHPSVKDRTIAPPQLPFPQWRGESLQGKSIVIWPEQALGDEIQICRYAAELKKLGASKVTFVCKPALKNLLEGVAGIDHLIVREQAFNIEIHDYWSLQFSLPYYCKTRVDSVPSCVPYLYAKEPFIAKLQPQIKKIKDFKIGICWKGSALYLADGERSPGLDAFRTLFGLQGVKFFTLLPNTRKEFIDAAGSAGVDIGHEIDSDTPPFEETAALISQMDLIVSSDTSVVHVAAALGKPVWLVLPYVADWRWIHGREDSPWYPNVRLIRQVQRSNWSEVFARVKERLEKVLSGDVVLWPIEHREDSSTLRLNLGCGGKNLSGWLNVDFVADCNPDLVLDLEKFPWPWADSSVSSILMNHVLEHLGQSRDVYFGLIKEMYRVCHHGAEIIIRVPHPRHDFYLIDPTHVRPITVDGMRMFDQKINQEWIRDGYSNTPLGIYLGVDLRVVSYEYVLDPVFQKKLNENELSHDEILVLLRTHNNVCQQINMTLMVNKE